MGDDKAWINLALFDALHQLGQIVLNSLGHAKRESAIDGATHGDVIEHAAINAHNRDRRRSWEGTPRSTG